MNFALRCTPKNSMIIFCMTLESPSMQLHQRMEMLYSLMGKPRDRKAKLHTKPDRRFSVYSDGLGNEVLTAAIS